MGEPLADSILVYICPFRLDLYLSKYFSIPISDESPLATGNLAGGDEEYILYRSCLHVIVLWWLVVRIHFSCFDDSGAVVWFADAGQPLRLFFNKYIVYVSSEIFFRYHT
jgi:hypothetical protein